MSPRLYNLSLFPREGGRGTFLEVLACCVTPFARQRLKPFSSPPKLCLHISFQHRCTESQDFGIISTAFPYDSGLGRVTCFQQWYVSKQNSSAGLRNTCLIGLTHSCSSALASLLEDATMEQWLGQSNIPAEGSNNVQLTPWVYCLNPTNIS